MRGRTVVAAGLLAAAVPAVAVAEQLPANSSYYSEDHHYSGMGSNVGFLVYWKKNKADIYVADNCLGNDGVYTNEATARGVTMRKDRLNYNGPARVYASGQTLHVTLRLSATVSRTKVTGTVAFPQTKGCSARSFTATVTSSRK